MRKTWLGGAMVACMLLSACGSSNPEGGPDVGTAPPSSSPSSSPPTAAPYPAFGAPDYSYVLQVSCFCGETGPVLVTVEDGTVVRAVDRKTGEDAPEYRRMSIDDVIDAANKADADGAAELRVRWRADEAYPRFVWIDQDRNMADEEVGYTVRHVEVAG